MLDESKNSNTPHPPSSLPQQDDEPVYRTSDYMAGEFAPDDSPPAAREPLPSEEDTADIVPVADAQLHAAGVRPEAPEGTPDRHDLPTMPLPESAEATDPRRTLPGSGGYDPNPDFSGRQADDPVDPVAAGFTVPHVVPFEHTMVHVPPEQGRMPPPSDPPYNLPPAQPAQYTNRGRAVNQPAYTQPNPSAYAPQPQPGSRQPPPYSGIPGQPGGAPPPVGGQPLPPKRRGKPRRRRILGCTPGCFAILVGSFVTFCGGLTLITLILTATLGARLEEQLTAQIEQVDQYQQFQSTFYYDRSGTLLYESFNEGRRENVNYTDFPQDLIDATIAIEDDSFWSNPGFEVQATARAFLQYVNLAEGSTGGSTITQQLVRNVLFTNEYRSERSVRRKVEEILLAILLTNRKNKEEILELYLNEIYYGNLAYGAQAAARTFFDKDVGALTLGEAALLAGLPQAPANLDPLNGDPAVQEAVYDRWRTVLDRMVTERFITDAERDAALSEGLTFRQPDVPLRAPHFTVFAQTQLETLMTNLGYSPEDVARGGLRVYTTVDLRINDMAEQTAAQQVATLAANNVGNAAVVVLKPGTGEILAMVGSIAYENEAIDGNVNVAISPRQPGSTMKPFTYAAGIETGVFTSADIVWDTPTDIAGYVPRNYDGTFHGPQRMRSALANSYNIPAVQTLRLVGVDYLLGIMQRFGVNSLGTDASQYGLSLTLGGGEVTLLELTRAYTVFANGGALVPSTAILCVLDNDNNILYQFENACPRGQTINNTVNEAGFGRQVLDPRVAFIISDILGDNVARTPAMGANSPLNTGELGAAVKTGTTNDIKDNWTVGYTRNVAVGVWVGNTRGEAMINSSGLTGAAPIWNAVMMGIYNNAAMLNQFGVEGRLQPDRLDPPQGVSLRRLCNISALRDPVSDCPSALQEWVLDSPAGIPDEVGNLQYPAGAQTGNEQPPAVGVWLREVEPDIYRVLVQPVAPEVASLIQFNLPAGQQSPPAPIYCQVPEEARAGAPAAREQLFIAPPPDAGDAARAEQYARSAGLAFLPTIACDANLLANPGGGGQPIVITAVISSPTAGQVMPSSGFPIVGTAEFSTSQATYYKVEITGGQFGASWYTIGATHANSVVNGQLEYVSGLAPGSYEIQLIVVGLDGNYVQPPFRVPFTVQ